LIALLLLAAAGCSEPPQKEIDQAQSAIDAARAAGADKYAADDYTGAESTLQKAHAAVDQRDYRLALSYAIDARQRAIEAEHAVAEARTRQKTDAEREFKAESDRTARLDVALREADSARTPAQQLRTAREAIEAARTSLQETRRLFDGGNYADAAPALAAVRENVDLAAKAVESIPQRGKASKRRH
jgi:predicted S18 family serine protease